MRLVQPHRSKTRTCLTRMGLTKPMRTTKSSAPLNQQRRSRSSEQRKLPGGCAERLADVFMEYNFCTGHSALDDVVMWSHETLMFRHPKMWFLERGLLFVSQKDVSHVFSMISFLIHIKKKKWIFYLYKKLNLFLLISITSINWSLVNYTLSCSHGLSHHYSWNWFLLLP